MRTLIFLLLAIIVSSCGKSGRKTQDSGKKTETLALTAAGATFPMPYYNMVFEKYNKEKGILITYGGIGSGGGIRSLTDKVIDFGATDAFIENDKLAEMPAEVVHIPTVLGAVVLAYNLPGIEGLKLTDVLLEKIFLGEITRWNDPLIKENNPETNLPNLAVTVVYRSDGSGTTHIFSDFMSKVSEKWKNKIGTGKTLNWPTGIGAKGNPGVAGTIKQAEGSIGYIGSEFAFAQKIQVAKIRNSSGNYVEPNIQSISASAKGEIPEDTRITLTNSADPDSYPISGFTWIILYKEQNYNNRTYNKAYQTVAFLDWLVSSEAQAEAEKVHYAPLPEKIVEKTKTILKSITFRGKPLLK